MNGIRMFAALALCGLLVLVTLSFQRPKLATDADALAMFEIPRHGEPLFVPVHISDEPLMFAVDTGASLLFLDSSLRSGADRPLYSTRMITAGDDARVKVYESPALFLGKMEVGRGARAVFWDLGPFREAWGYRVSGILGMDALYKSIIQLDFDQGRLTFLKCVRPNNDWGARVPITFDRLGTPFVLLSVAGEELPFDIDTGADATCISADVLRSLKRRNAAIAVSKTRFRSLTGDRTATIYRLARLSLGGFEHVNTLALEGNGCRIGLEYLSRFRVTFDFPGGQMYLKKGFRYHDQDKLDLSGLDLLLDQQRLVVDSVDPNSAGEAAGIRAGDQLIRMDGKDSRFFSLSEIRQLGCSREGRRIYVELLRAGDTVNTVLTLKPTPFHE